MNYFRPNYAHLDLYLSNHETLNDKWIQLSDSLRGDPSRQEDDLVEYAKDYGILPCSRLPPVFRFTQEQRQLYREILDQLNPLYRKLAIKFFGAPFPEQIKAQDLVGLVIWVDEGRKWDFSLTGQPLDPLEVIRYMVKDTTHAKEFEKREAEKK